MLLGVEAQATLKPPMRRQLLWTVLVVELVWLLMGSACRNKCTADQKEANGRCLSPCNGQQDCLGREQCANGYCEPVSTLTDAGATTASGSSSAASSSSGASAASSSGSASASATLASSAASGLSSSGGSTSGTASSSVASSSSSAAAASSGGGVGTGLNALYFADPTFNSACASRVDARVDFDWGTAAPAPSCPTDSFSVRWFGSLEAPVSGIYTLQAEANNAIRVWVDRRLVLDRWDSPLSEWVISADTTLLAGLHALRVDFREDTSSASVLLSWVMPGDVLQVVPRRFLYPADNLPADVESPDQVKDLSASGDSVVQLTWAGVGDDGSVGMPQRYVVKMNPTPIHEYNWWQLPALPLVVLGAPAGARTVMLPGVDAGPAMYFAIKAYDEEDNPSMTSNTAAYVRPGGPPLGLMGEYFANETLSGSATITRVDLALDWAWAIRFPEEGPYNTPESFSIRWTGFLVPPFTGTGMLVVQHDDGVRVRVNGVLRINSWSDGSTEHSTSFVAQADTPIPLQIDYYQAAGIGALRVFWIPPGGEQTIIPPTGYRQP